jgi:RNA recognition motif-containing protein
MASNQPNATLYVNNLNDKVNTKELRSQLFALFTTYGKIIDIVTSKGLARRGQAFLVFTDLAGATSAMRACEGMVFYDKPLVSPFTQLYILPVIFKPQPITQAHRLRKNKIIRDFAQRGPIFRLSICCKCKHNSYAKWAGSCRKETEGRRFGRRLRATGKTGKNRR